MPAKKMLSNKIKTFKTSCQLQSHMEKRAEYFQLLVHYFKRYNLQIL